METALIILAGARRGRRTVAKLESFVRTKVVAAVPAPLQYRRGGSASPASVSPWRQCQPRFSIAVAAVPAPLQYRRGGSASPASVSPWRQCQLRFSIAVAAVPAPLQYRRGGSASPASVSPWRQCQPRFSIAVAAVPAPLQYRRGGSASPASVSPWRQCQPRFSIAVAAVPAPLQYRRGGSASPASVSPWRQCQPRFSIAVAAVPATLQYRRGGSASPASVSPWRQCQPRFSIAVAAVPAPLQYRSFGLGYFHLFHYQFGKKKEEKGKSEWKASLAKQAEILSVEELERMKDERERIEAKHQELRGRQVRDRFGPPNVEDDDGDPNYARINTFKGRLSPSQALYGNRSPSPQRSAPHSREPSGEDPLNSLYAKVNKPRGPPPHGPDRCVEASHSSHHVATSPQHRGLRFANGLLTRCFGELVTRCQGLCLCCIRKPLNAGVTAP
ncbi:hypothetical protein P4O66_002456 [Electrophorus voltai]|uniref:Uncharacterized protein n=1 Tax=Electrophorus voltai TaxID=2609070 RepID=A0AAD8YX25_9TELE|nr:hypothetical protein P4O66_002456 [Electrophorus voltai]